jgi:hypothetical protein
LNTKNNIAKEFIKKSVLSLDLDNSEVMVVWCLRHWASCSISGEDPQDLFKLCREQHQLPDISSLIEEVVYGIAEGTEEKGPIGSELCNHVHYGEFKILEALCMLQNDKYEDAQLALQGWLKTNQARNIFKILNAFAAILEKANLIIPSRRQYSLNRFTH